MKKILLPLLLSLSLLGGCSQQYSRQDKDLIDVLMLFQKVTKTYKYRSEKGSNEDYWQSPKETRERRDGDCEDLAVLLHEELTKRGIDTRIIIGNAFYLDLTQEKPKYHAWCEIKVGDKIYIADPSLRHFLSKEDCRKTCYIEITRDFGEFILETIKLKEKLENNSPNQQDPNKM